MVCKKINVSVSFVAFLCAFYYFDPMQSFTPFLLSAAFHELGHLLALRLCGAEIKMIRLRAFGTQIVTLPIAYRKEYIVAAAGPLSNFLLLLFSAKKLPLLALVNFGLLFYNLLPIYPLDGGRMLRASLSMLFPEHIVHILEKTVGGLCLLTICCASCYLTCVWHAGLWPILVCAMLIMHLTETILPEKIKFCV